MAEIPSTQWTLISKAKSSDKQIAEEALDTLCKRYGGLIRDYVGICVKSSHDADDLTHDFILKKVMSGKVFQTADKDKGKLRTLLLTAIKRFIQSEWRKTQAQKRGSGAEHLSIEQAAEEGWHGAEPADTMTPDRIFQQRWAVALLEAAMNELREEHVRQGKAEIFDTLRAFLGMLPPDAEEITSRQAAAKLGMSEGAVRVATHRLQKRFVKILEQHVAMTLEEPTAENIRDELSELNGFL